MRPPAADPPRRHLRTRTIAVTADCDSRFTAFRGAQVLITGGVGLIGSALARRLVEFGADRAGRLHGRRGRRQPCQHRRHPRPRRAQHRRYPRRGGDAPSARRPGFSVRPRRPDQPSRLDDMRRNTISRSIAPHNCSCSKRAARWRQPSGSSMPARARSMAGRATCRSMSNTRCGRPTSTASTRWPARLITCCSTMFTASTPARCD